MGMGLCVAFIAFVRLPSLKVSTLLLTGLLIYDVFWVFFSSYIFNTNVMVKVRYCTVLFCIVVAVWMIFPLFCVCVCVCIWILQRCLQNCQRYSQVLVHKLWKKDCTWADWKVFRLLLFLFPGIRRGSAVLGFVKVIHWRVWTCSWTAVAFSIWSQRVEALSMFCHGGWGRRLCENMAEVCDWILC